MSDEREQNKPGEPDFQLHQAKPGEMDRTKPGEPEGEGEADVADDGDDFEAHQLKPGGFADQLKSQLK
jgi:hypothetical protein